MVIFVNEKCLLLVISIASSLFHYCIAQELPACNPNMLNIAVYRGQSTSFPDLFPNAGSDSVNWRVASSNADFQSLRDITNYDNTVASSFNDTYKVSKTQLTILNATMGNNGSDPTAGVYIANYYQTCSAAAALTVVDNPMCSLDASASTKLTCSITFANYAQLYIIPNMTWIDSSGNVVQSTVPEQQSLDGDNLGLQESLSELKVAPGDTAQYSCLVTFTEPDPRLPDIIAKNAPDFIANCSISSISTTTAATTTTTKAPTATTPPVTTTTKLSTVTTVATSTATSPTQTSTTQMSTTAAAPLNCSIGELQNIAAYKDSPSWFPNVINRQNVQWQVGPYNTPFEPVSDITDPNGNPISKFAGLYAVNQSQLTIFKSTIIVEGSMPFPTAGLYLLNYQNLPECTIGAGLTVVESPPTCGIIGSNSQSPKLTCSITYANYVGQYIIAIMTWTDSNQNVLLSERPVPDSLDASNLGLQRSTSTLTVSPDDTKPYHCQVNFSDPASTQPSFIASNAPNYNGFCNITNNSTTTTIATTKAATTTSTVAPPTGTITSITATVPIQVSAVSTNSPITNTAVTPASTPSTTAQQQTETVVPPESATTSSTISPPASPVSQPGSTVSLSSSSGSTVSMSSSSESTSPSTIQPSTETNGPNTISTIVSTLVNQQSTVSSSSAPVSLLSSSVPVSLSSATTSKAPSLTTAALSNSPRQELVTDDPQVQATSIVLGLVLGSLVTTGLVSACWCYCCFFPIGAKGVKRKQRILLVRRKFLFWRNEPPVEDIYRRNYPPIGRPFQSREPVAPENPWRYPALRKTFHWREPNENGNFWRWDPAANDPYSRRDFNAIET